MYYQTVNKLKTWTWYDFTRTNIDHVETVPGVYALGDSQKTIYIGSSNSLRDRLNDHYNSSDPCIRRATRFAIEPCDNPIQREREKLQWYKSKYGKLPDCNDRV